MNIVVFSLRCCATLGASLALTLGAAASDSAAQEQAAALRGLDADIARLDVCVEKISELPLQETTRGFIAKFKETQAKLHQAFDQAKFDEVKFEVTDEFQRLSQWLAFPLAPAPGSVEAVTGRQVVYLLEPDGGSPAEIKAALQSADDEIMRQEKERASGSFAFDQAAEKARIATLRGQRAGLQRVFTSTGWTALLARMKSRL